MAIEKLEITSRQPLFNGRSFENVGSYEQLDGTAHFALDPEYPLNRGITDILLAQQDKNGQVHFAADFCIIAPVDPDRGNHRLLFDVVNRGNKVALSLFNRARPAPPHMPLDPGDGFLMNQGYTVVWCGWQHDVPEVNGLMRIKVPEARNADGPISGKILVKFQPNSPGQVQLLSDRLHRPYPASNLHDPEATLLERDADETPSRIIPRDRWSFAILEGGKAMPDASHIFMESGFVPGKLYQVVYTTIGAPVIGFGLLTARDFVSFLRYGTPQKGNPYAHGIERAYAFGASQSGRYLRQFLYMGLNEDELERQVFDGLLVHIAGAKRGGDFNQRFGQPSSTMNPSMSDMFPFTDTTQSDPETGHSGGLLDRLAERNKLPKIFFTNSSAEYWRGDCSLIHTDVSGTRDVPHSESVRIYHYAGTQHVPGALPLTDTSPLDRSRGQHAFNCVDYSPLLRAALVRLDRWVTADEIPPQSRHPRLDDGTAVPAAQTAAVMTSIPGLQFPSHLPRVVRRDFGPRAESGIATILPPKEGRAYLTFVPALDADGNELGGIRLPDLSVPLATYTGWNGRHPDMGAPDQIMGLMGSTLPFKPTRITREASSDPRLSIEDRYLSKADYLDRVIKAAQTLIADGFLLGDDLQMVLDQASRRYEAFHG